MKFRFWEPADLESLRPIFEENKGPIPDLNTTIGVLAEDDDGNIVACGSLQVMLHAGNLWVHPDHRGQRVWEKLFDKLNEKVQPGPGMVYLTFPTNEKAAHAAQKLGFEPLPWPVFKKEF